MYTIQQLERAVKNERKKNESILIDVMFTLIDIEEDIHTNSFPREKIEERSQKLKENIARNLTE